MVIMNNVKTIALDLIQGVLFKFALHRKIIKKMTIKQNICRHFCICQSAQK